MHTSYEVNKNSNTSPERPRLIETGQGIGRVEAFYGNSDPELFSELIPIREAFVIDKMHWRTIGHNDADPYDFNPDTLQLALRVERPDGDKVLSSIRMTNVPLAEKALSVHMFAEKEALFAQANEALVRYGLDATAERGNLFDITRLVSNIYAINSKEELLGSFMELFGVAAGVARNRLTADGTRENQENLEDIKWIFVVTDTIKRELETQGVEMTELAHGIISDDDETNGWVSHFCLVHQESAIRAVQANAATLPNSYPHLRDGLEKTGWTL